MIHLPTIEHVPSRLPILGPDGKPFPVHKRTCIGNKKLGKRIPTESRPTGHTCPSTCPFNRPNVKVKGKWMRSPCYSEAIGIYHRSVPAGIMARHLAWSIDRAGWRERRRREWTAATRKNRPVRFLVHGDVCRIGNPSQLDREWIADVIRVARSIPGFRGWGYSHAWRLLGERHRKALARAGITFYASVHSAAAAGMARAMGFRIAMISTVQKRGYKGPKAIPVDGKMTIVCPQQTGKRVDCESCGICPRGSADIVLLRH